MLPRHRQILEYVRQRGDASIDTLARVPGVTTQATRRGIRQFENECPPARYRNGVGLSSLVENIDYNQRQVLYINAKRRIVKVVARYVGPGRSLIINISTATEEVSKVLVGPNDPCGLRVITNNLNVAPILSGSPDVEVVVTDGLMCNRDRDIVGEAMIDFMKQFCVDVGIVGVSSIDEDGALLDYDHHEVRVARSTIEQSCEVRFAVDHSKFGRCAIVRLGHVPQIDKLFTDTPVPEPMVEILRVAEVNVIIASGTY